MCVPAAAKALTVVLSMLGCCDHCDQMAFSNRQIWKNMSMKDLLVCTVARGHSAAQCKV